MILDYIFMDILINIVFFLMDMECFICIMLMDMLFGIFFFVGLIILLFLDMRLMEIWGCLEYFLYFFIYIFQKVVICYCLDFRSFFCFFLDIMCLIDLDFCLMFIFVWSNIIIWYFREWIIIFNFSCLMFFQQGDLIL